MFSEVSDEELQGNENNFADSLCKDGTDRKGYNPGKDNIAFNTPLDCRQPIGCPADTILQTTKVNVSCIFQDNRFNDVCDIFTLVRGILEVLIDFFPLYDQDRVLDLVE